MERSDGGQVSGPGRPVPAAPGDGAPRSTGGRRMAHMYTYAPASACTPDGTYAPSGTYSTVRRHRCGTAAAAGTAGRHEKR